MECCRHRSVLSMGSEGTFISDVNYEGTIRLVLFCVLDRAHERTLKRGKTEIAFQVKPRARARTGHISDAHHLPWKPISPSSDSYSRNTNFKE